MWLGVGRVGVNLSVVVPTLNARDQLSDCLDAVAEHAADAELIVVNGPSADGTTGMIQDRDDIDVLVELADRTINAARNAGIDRAEGDRIAFIDHTLTISPDWRESIREHESASVVTGPTRTQLASVGGLSEPETRTIAGRDVSYYNPGNVAFDRSVLDELDGFDEYLEIGGARDMAHRLASNDFDVEWTDSMLTTEEVGADGGEAEKDWAWHYRSLSYRLVKNYNVRPTVVWRLLSHAAGDATAELREVLDGADRPSEWFGNGRTVLTNLFGGVKDGLASRRRDRSTRRNPRGRSSRSDRAVTVYDWR